MENNTFEIGTNLNEIVDWSPQYPFMDSFKSSTEHNHLHLVMQLQHGHYPRPKGADVWSDYNPHSI